MKVARGYIAAAILLTLGASSLAAQNKKGPANPGLTLTTTAFSDGGEIPARFTQNDPNAVSPKLDWTNVPANTASFVLLFHDPDVAMQRKTDDVTHWMAFNIPGTATGLPEGVPAEAKLADGTVQVIQGHCFGAIGREHSAREKGNQK